MRETSDRIRHAVLFELIALGVVTPIGGAIFAVPMSEFGIVALVSTTIAMAWNYAFNLIFDHALLRMSGSVRKTLTARILHAALFEMGLLCLLVPFIAWYLRVTLWQAFVMDVSLAGFYLVYAFAFNWVYDILFPLPETEVA